ncbi:hypothetical protein FHR75_002402 [Kineococcus radiotolerans]|uniref:non-specific serine/threonine protein kinase n=1 Tax=Kineococcus radiotolerans TaxID=131568 RepID=A0A7W4TN58_KINRA|nr:serine/threonine protein kinase [Kineococcus radiotolerans]MBB2901587.1 hypothetical protein [Kineococcus radiotolerans]
MDAPEPLTQPAPVRQWRREALAALGDDPRRRPPVVDGYRTGRLLGAGGSGVVWSGTGLDDVERALKVLHTGGPGDLLAELSMLRRVRHPRVVAVHDISTDDEGRPVLVLDLAPGGSLAALLTQRRRLSAGEVSGLLSVLGPALEDLHSAGVVHGDIAPGNVLLDAHGEPLLADLGVSRALGRRHGSVLGTPGFADPAALAGGGVGAASDVYGLAALGWWALTGEAPVRAGALGARRAVRRAAADLPPGSAAAVLTALQEGLQRNPSRRPTPGELATAVTAVSRPRPVRGLVPAPPVGVPRRAPDGGTAAVPPPPGATRALPVPAPAPSSARPAPAAGGGRSTAAPGRRRAGREATAARRAAPARPHRRPLLVVAAGVVLVAGTAVLLPTLREGDPAPPAAPSTAPAVAPPGPAAAEGAPAADPAAAPVAAPVPAPVAPVEGDGDEGAEVLRGVDPVAVVTELAARRARALSAGDRALLDLVDVPGSPAAAADAAVLTELAAAGTVLAGLGFEVVDVRPGVAGADRWVLDADVVTTAHEVVAGDGTSSAVAAGAPRTSRLTLERVAGEWRISAVG